MRDNADPMQLGSVTNYDLTPNSDQSPASAESVIQIAATGYGPLDATNQASVEVLLADSPGKVISSSPSSQTALWLILARVPSGAYPSLAAKSYPVSIIKLIITV